MLEQQIQNLEQQLQLTARLENEELQNLVGSEIIFKVTDSDLVCGRLKTVGEHFLFLEDVRILCDYGIGDYLSRKESIEGNVVSEQDFGAYNKRNIAQIYPFDFSS